MLVEKRTNRPGLTAIVLELVEGETLADMVVRGPLATSEAPQIARQIAVALEAAHEKDIVQTIDDTRH